VCVRVSISAHSHSLLFSDVPSIVCCKYFIHTLIICSSTITRSGTPTWLVLPSLTVPSRYDLTHRYGTVSTHSQVSVSISTRLLRMFDIKLATYYQHCALRPVVNDWLVGCITTPTAFVYCLQGKIDLTRRVVQSTRRLHEAPSSWICQ